MRLALVLLFACGCRQVFGIDTPALPEHGDGRIEMNDGPDSVALDAAAPSCIATWTSHRVSLGDPQLVVAAQSSAARAPVVSPDQRTIWFAQGPTGSQHIATATRSSPTGMFGTATAFAPTASVGVESKVSFSADQLTLVVASMRNPMQGYDLFRATRTTTSTAFGALAKGPFAGSDDANAQLDPWVNEDGSIVYFTTSQALQRLQLSNLQTLTYNLTIASPTLLDGERVVVYATPTGDLAYATRLTLDAPFDPATTIATLGAVDPYVTADGCRVYAAVSTAQLFEIYQADVVAMP